MKIDLPKIKKNTRTLLWSSFLVVVGLVSSAWIRNDKLPLLLLKTTSAVTNSDAIQLTAMSDRGDFINRLFFTQTCSDNTPNAALPKMLHLSYEYRHPLTVRNQAKTLERGGLALPLSVESITKK